MTSGQETERLYSYNPGAHTGQICMQICMHTAVASTNRRDNDIILLLEVDSAVATCQNTAEIHEAAIDTNK